MYASISELILGFQQGRDDFADDTRSWNRKIRPEYGFDEDYEGEEDEDDREEEEDRSLDLLLRFVENVFRKISKRARKAVRSILPVSISTKLVSLRTTLMIVSSFLINSKIVKDAYFGFKISDQDMFLSNFG